MVCDRNRMWTRPSAGLAPVCPSPRYGLLLSTHSLLNKTSFIAVSRQRPVWVIFCLQGELVDSVSRRVVTTSLRSRKSLWAVEVSVVIKVAPLLSSDAAADQQKLVCPSRPTDFHTNSQMNGFADVPRTLEKAALLQAWDCFSYPIGCQCFVRREQRALLVREVCHLNNMWVVPRRFVRPYCKNRTLASCSSSCPHSFANVSVTNWCCLLAFYRKNMFFGDVF